MSELLVVIIAGIVAVFSGGAVAYWQRPKIHAETESIAVTTLTSALNVANNRITALEKAMTEVRAELASVLEERDTPRGERDHFLAGNEILTGQVRELGGVPRWPN